MRIIIPGRKGSKGLPFKNRLLFEQTADIIPHELRKSVWVTSDDSVLKTKSKQHNFNFIKRPDSLCQDDTSIRDVLVNAICHIKPDPDEFILLLYLTYPERTWVQIKQAIDFFLDHYKYGGATSMLCKKELKTNPFLCLREHGVDGNYGRQLVSHDLYRRQDYPKCFEISHYICFFQVSVINKLNKNMYDDSTVFYNIPDVIDVDTQEDLDGYTKK